MVALLIKSALFGVGVCLKSLRQRSCRRRLRPCRKHHPRLDLAVAHPWWRHLLERVPMMYPTALTPILVGLVVGIMVSLPVTSLSIPSLMERVPVMYPTALTPILVGLIIGIMVTPPETSFSAPHCPLLERVPMMYLTTLMPILVRLVVGIMLGPLRPDTSLHCNSVAYQQAALTGLMCCGIGRLT